jgi:hypothetical protein
MGILGTILGFYFGERKTDGENHDAEIKLSKIRTICRDNNGKPDCGAKIKNMLDEK